jgi:hypothetical protein
LVSDMRTVLQVFGQTHRRLTLPKKVWAHHEDLSKMVAIRATRVLRGQYSRMMDLGGIPSAKIGPIRSVDGSKTCRVRAVAIDFDLLTRAVDQATTEKETLTASETSPNATTLSSPVFPIVDKGKRLPTCFM